MLKKDYIALCAVALFLSASSLAQGGEPVFVVENTLNRDAPALDIRPSSFERYSDAQRKAFCREVVEGARAVNRKLPVHLDGQSHIGLRQIMVEYTSVGECRVIAQVLIRENGAVKAMAREVYGNELSRRTDRKARLSVMQDWIASGKGVGSIVAGISRSLLQRPAFAKFTEVPFVRLEVGAVLIGAQVKEFAFPIRSARESASSNRVWRMVCQLLGPEGFRACKKTASSHG